MNFTQIQYNPLVFLPRQKMLYVIRKTCQKTLASLGTGSHEIKLLKVFSETDSIRFFWLTIQSTISWLCLVLIKELSALTKTENAPSLSQLLYYMAGREVFQNYLISCYHRVQVHHTNADQLSADQKTDAIIGWALNLVSYIFLTLSVTGTSSKSNSFAIHQQQLLIILTM